MSSNKEFDSFNTIIMKQSHYAFYYNIKIKIYDIVKI